jgi:hypothetical protein
MRAPGENASAGAMGAMGRHGPWGGLLELRTLLSIGRRFPSAMTNVRLHCFLCLRPHRAPGKRVCRHGRGCFDLLDLLRSL